MFHDHENVRRRRDNFVKLDNVGVPESFEVFDFPLYPADHVHIDDPTSIYDFDCHAHPSRRMDGHCTVQGKDQGNARSAISEFRGDASIERKSTYV